MRSLYIIVTVLIASVTFSEVTEAQSRCPADDMNCNSQNWETKVNERIEKGKRDVNNARGPSKKVKQVWSTIEDCTDCALKQFTGPAETVGQ